jgi:hypothetical protein
MANKTRTGNIHFMVNEEEIFDMNEIIKMTSSGQMRKERDKVVNVPNKKRLK